MKLYLLVMLGGAIGSAGRHWISTVIAVRLGEAFPTGTLAVNVIGSFVIGLIFALTGPNSPLLVAPEWRTFLMLGVLGGFTTFSSFSLQTLILMQSGQWLFAAGNVIGSVLLCLTGVWLAYSLASLFLQRL